MAKKRKGKPLKTLIFSGTSTGASFYLSYETLDCIDNLCRMTGMGRSDVVDFIFAPFVYPVRKEHRKCKATKNLRNRKYPLKLNFSHIYSTIEKEKLEQEVRDVQLTERQTKRHQ